jgi:hypothetical protein
MPWRSTASLAAIKVPRTSLRIETEWEWDWYTPLPEKKREERNLPEFAILYEREAAETARLVFTYWLLSE